MFLFKHGSAAEFNYKIIICSEYINKIQTEFPRKGIHTPPTMSSLFSIHENVYNESSCQMLLNENRRRTITVLETLYYRAPSLGQIDS